jgi:hypothetical protein
VVASISSPLIKANIDEYYISSYHTGYCFIPSEKLDLAKELFLKHQVIVINESMLKNNTNNNSNNNINNLSITSQNEDIFEMNGTNNNDTQLTNNNNNNNESNNIITLSNLKLNTVKTNN